jgi:hypothetical protein
MRVGLRHSSDMTAWFDVVPCPEADRALSDPNYLKPPQLKRSATKTGVDTPTYPWPPASATLEGLTHQPRPSPKGSGKGPTKAELLKQVQQMQLELEQLKKGKDESPMEFSPPVKQPPPRACPKTVPQPPKVTPPSSEDASAPSSTTSWFNLDREPATRRQRTLIDEAIDTPANDRMQGQEMSSEALEEAELLSQRLRELSQRHPDLERMMAGKPAASQ